MTDESYLAQALTQARQAEAAGEVPVGAVLVLDGRIIAEAHNSPITTNDPTATSPAASAWRACMRACAR